MAKNVIINGVQYANVPSVLIPLAAGGGNAVFVDTDSGDAVAADIRNGKKAWVDGSEVTGNMPNASVAVGNANVSVTETSRVEDDEHNCLRVNVSGSQSVGATLTTGYVENGTTVPTSGTASASGFVDVEYAGYDFHANTPTKSGNVVSFSADFEINDHSGGYMKNSTSLTRSTSYTIQTEEKTATPSGSSQEITPASGKYLTKVTVSPVSLSGNADPSKVLSGYTFYSDSLTKQTGTLSVPAVSYNTSTHILTIS